MPQNVLELSSPGLAALAESADDAIKRAITVSLCQWAVERVIPNDETVRLALAALKRGAYGDQALCASLQHHVDELDEAYFAARDAGRDYDPIFAQARVAEAVLCGLSSDPFDAMANALYEICAVLGHTQVEAEVNRLNL
ncbi:MAG: hypothetical protein ACREFQ_05195 [Stellaceae bacterium]